jgi:transcriptional regulator with XRE-family HTH domain
MNLETLKSRLLARRPKWHEIAARAGVHHKTIQRIADGRNIPNMATAERIEGALRRKRSAETEPA